MARTPPSLFSNRIAAFHPVHWPRAKLGIQGKAALRSTCRQSTRDRGFVSSKTCRFSRFVPTANVAEFVWSMLCTRPRMSLQLHTGVGLLLIGIFIANCVPSVSGGGKNMDAGSQDAGADVSTGNALDCTNDPSVCPVGYGCKCGGGGPSPWPCHCGLLCTGDNQCTDTSQPVCCGAPTGICTDVCTCYCD